MLLTYAGSNVFQLYTAVHLSDTQSDRREGDTEFRPGLQSFSITYDVSLESTLIELPNLFFKQQCPGPDPWRETIRYKFKIRQFAYFIFPRYTLGWRQITYGVSPPPLFFMNEFYYPSLYIVLASLRVYNMESLTFPCLYSHMCMMYASFQPKVRGLFF